MLPNIRVHLLPDLFAPDQLRGGVAVVIDVLRASTTIAEALAAGATEVVPCGEIEEAHRLAANRTAGSVVLGGERGGRLIDGFDLDNSPARYTADSVGGKSVVFTTTNGTRALLRARQADRVFIGAFVNVDAVVNRLIREERAVHLVCAGTDGEVTAEDCLFAGAVAVNLYDLRGGAPADDACRMVMDFFTARSQTRESFLDALRTSSGGRNLQELGLDADIERAAEWNRSDVVPEFFAATGEIRVAGEPPARSENQHAVVPPRLRYPTNW